MLYPQPGRKGDSDMNSCPQKKEEKLSLKTVKPSLPFKSYEEAREKQMEITKDMTSHLLEWLSIIKKTNNKCG